MESIEALIRESKAHGHCGEILPAKAESELDALTAERNALRDICAGSSLCTGCQKKRNERKIIATPRIQVEEERDALREEVERLKREAGEDWIEKRHWLKGKIEERDRYRAVLERIKAVTLENTARRIIEEALGDDG
jgi:hypothetical protein